MRYDISHKAIEMSYKALESKVNLTNNNIKKMKVSLDNLESTVKKVESDAFKSGLTERVEEAKRLLEDYSKCRDELLPILEEMKSLYEQDKVKNYYFTFGDSPTYPFKADQYVLVKARDDGQAIRTFKTFFPHNDDIFTINCAGYYTQKEWDIHVSSYYKDFATDAVKEPAAVLDLTDDETNENILRGECYD